MVLLNIAVIYQKVNYITRYLVAGDIEDFPGLDSIPKYDIEVAEGQVRVKANKPLLASGKRTKTMAKRDPENPSIYVIIGGGKNLAS